MLRPEEGELWRRVAATTRPLRPDAKLPLTKAQDAPAMPEPPGFELKPFRLGETAARPPQRDAGPQPRLDARVQRRMERGKLRPEGRLDLHGMRLDEAHAALRGFVFDGHSRGRRLLLVITGKGGGGDDPIPERRGVLRHPVPHWLSVPPLAPLVQDVRPAHRSHGGAGALYVYLRRRKG